MAQDADNKELAIGDYVVRIPNSVLPSRITQKDIDDQTVYKVTTVIGHSITLEGKDPEYKYTAANFRKVEGQLMTQANSSEVNNWIVICQFGNGNLSAEMFPTEQLADASAILWLTKPAPPKKVYYAKVLGTYSVKTEVIKNSLEELSNLDILE